MATHRLFPVHPGKGIVCHLRLATKYKTPVRWLLSHITCNCINICHGKRNCQPPQQSEEIVLWLPEERNDAMQILVMLEEIDGDRSASADRWRIYHGSPGQSHWVNASLLAVRFGSIVADAEQLDLTNALASSEPRLCKKYNADHDLLGRAARTMDPRSSGEGVLVGVDPMGFDIRTRFDIVRVPFGERLIDAEQADVRVHNLLSELSAAG